MDGKHQFTPTLLAARRRHLVALGVVLGSFSLVAGCASAPRAVTTAHPAAPPTVPSAPATTAQETSPAGRRHSPADVLELLGASARAFPDGLVLLAGGRPTRWHSGARVLASRDFGASFTDVTPPSLTSAGWVVEDMTAADARHWWVLGWNVDSTRARVYRTIDAGQTWIAAAVPGHNESAGSRDTISFTGAHTGWLTQLMPNGDVSTLYATVDGGGHWHRVDAHLPQVAPVVAAPASGLWQGGGFFAHRLTHSSDGRTWSATGPAIAGGDSRTISAPGSFGHRVVVATSSLTNRTETLRFATSTDTGNTWQQISRLGALGGEPVAHGTVRRAQVTFAGPRSWWVIAATPHSTVYVTADAGAHWRTHQLPVRATGKPWLQVTASDARHAVAIVTTGDTSRLLRTADSGRHWTKLRWGRAPTPAAGAAAQCRSTQLTARDMADGGEASQPFDTIVLRNHSDQICTLRGYPRLTAFGHLMHHGAAKRIPIAVRRGSIYERHDPGPHQVVLHPGDAAWSYVGTGEAYQGGAHMLILTRLRLGLPAGGGAVDVTARLPASHPRGGPTPIGITAFQAAPGAGVATASSTSNRPGRWSPQSVVAASPQVVYVLARGTRGNPRQALFVSTDAGRRYQRVTLPSAAGLGRRQSVTELVFLDARHGYAVVRGSGRAWPGRTALAQTSDSGRSWQQASIPLGDREGITAVAGHGGRVFVGTVACLDVTHCPTVRLYTAAVPGNRWHRVAGHIPRRNSDSGITLAAWRQTVWLMVGVGATTHPVSLYSTDAGRSFHRSPGPGAVACSATATSTQVMWASCSTGMLMALSRTTADTSTRRLHLLGAGTANTFLDPITDRLSYFGTAAGRQRGLYRTRDAGRTLHKIAPLPPADVSAGDGFHITYLTTRTALCAVGDGRLLRSTDAGRSWQRVYL